MYFTADEISLRVSTSMVHSCLTNVIEQLVQLNPSSGEVEMILRFHVIFSGRFYQNHSRHLKKYYSKGKDANSYYGVFCHTVIS